jgi:Zn-dependent protease
MDQAHLLQGLITFLCFIPVLTFHEFAHAWTAWKCGDDTARLRGRVSLNPIVHIDPIGTILLPLIAIFLSASGSALAGFIIGWGKPVPVNIANLRHRRRDDTLIALAGPAMNILLAIVLMGFAKIGALAHSELLIESALRITQVSLFLCFFNLLPIPPLDGSHVLMNAIGMSYETYFKLCQYGFIMVIVAVQFQPVWIAIEYCVNASFIAIGRLYGIGA